MHIYDLSNPSDRIIGKVLAFQARVQPDAEWLVEEGRSLTFGEADVLVNRYANALAALGVTPGKVVAMVMEPSIEVILLSFATSRIGGIFMTVSTDFTGGFLCEAIAACMPQVLVIDAALAPRLDKLDEIGGAGAVLVNGDSPAGKWSARPLATLREASPTPPSYEPHWLEPMQVWWSSGTTGKPKGVMHAHSSVLMQVLSHDRDIREGDTLYSCTPVYLGSPWTATVWPSVVFGVRAAIDAKFSVSRFWDRIRHYGATQAFTLGAMHILLWKAPPSPSDTNHNLRPFVGIPMPHDLMPKFNKRFGIGAMSQGYGTSETFRVFDAPDDDSDKTGALIGTPVPRFEVKLLDKEDLEVPQGTAGEICVRSREPGHLFLGYFRDPQRTLDAWSSLWHHTGDMAVQKEDGQFYFADRKKDYIRYKGRSLSMFEIEQIVDKHDGVADVAAYGITSAELESESELMVAVVRRPGAAFGPEEVARFVNDNAPYFFVPRFIRFIDELPRNAHGRIQKEDLRCEGVTADTWDRESTDFVVTRD